MRTTAITAITVAQAIALVCAVGLNASRASAQTPINDLGTGSYLNQYQGGLYPGGSNAMPAGHFGAAMARSVNMQPLNTAGQPDPNGKYVLMSVGMSNTSQEWCGQDSSLTSQPYSLMGQAASHAAVDHSRMVIFNGARGGQRRDVGQYQ